MTLHVRHLRRCRPGFSLLETLVAFTIMALVLAALLPGQAALLGRARDASETVLAQDYALSVIEAAGIVDPLRPGEEAHDYRGWRVTRVVTTEELRDRAFHRVSVAVHDASGRPLAAMETLRRVR